MNHCVECGADIRDGEIRWCSEACRFAWIRRRRGEVIAERKPLVHIKPTWRAKVTKHGIRKPVLCDHRHRTKLSAIRCGDKRSDPVNDLVRAVRWKDD